MSKQYTRNNRVKANARLPNGVIRGIQITGKKTAWWVVKKGDKLYAMPGTCIETRFGLEFWPKHDEDLVWIMTKHRARRRRIGWIASQEDARQRDAAEHRKSKKQQLKEAA